MFHLFSGIVLFFYKIKLFSNVFKKLCRYYDGIFVSYEVGLLQICASIFCRCGLAILLVSCAAADISVNGIVVGSNDIERLSDIRSVLASHGASDVLVGIADSSVLVVTAMAGENAGEIKTCSGSLIEVEGEFKILSNHHCFAKSEIRENTDSSTSKVSLEELLPEACVQTRIYFNFPRSASKETLVFKCRPGSLRVDYLLDLAIFSLDGSPVGFKPIEIWTGGNLPLNRKMFVIHYPRTSGQNKAKLPDVEALAPVKMITINDCFFKGGFAMDLWQMDQSIPYWIKHTCDMQPGSSGSSLLDLETGKIVAVNRGSINLSRSTGSGGITTHNQSEYNVGSFAKFVEKFIAGEEIPEATELTEIPGE